MKIGLQLQCWSCRGLFLTWLLLAFSQGWSIALGAENSKSNEDARPKVSPSKLTFLDEVMLIDVIIAGVTGPDFDLTEIKRVRAILVALYAKQPLHPRLNATLGSLYEIQRDLENARLHFSLAFKLDPAGPVGKLAYAALVRITLRESRVESSSSKFQASFNKILKSGDEVGMDGLLKNPNFGSSPAGLRSMIRVCHGDGIDHVLLEEFQGKPKTFCASMKTHLLVVQRNFRCNQLVRQARELENTNPSKAADFYVQASEIAPGQRSLAYAALKNLLKSRRMKNATKFLSEMKSRGIAAPPEVEKVLSPPLPQVTKSENKPTSDRKKAASAPKTTTSTLSDQFRKRIGK